MGITKIFFTSTYSEIIKCILMQKKGLKKFFLLSKNENRVRRIATLGFMSFKNVNFFRKIFLT